MSKLRAIIVEDDKSIQVVIKTLLQQFEDKIEVTLVSRSVQDAIDNINTLNPDIVFLDVEIIGGSGFDVLDNTKSANYNIIFITASNSYAIKALRADAIDYIVKPIIKADFTNAVNRLLSKVNTQVYNQQRDTIMVRGANRDTKVFVDDILYIYIEKGSCRFHLKNSDKIHSLLAITKYKLTDTLYQVHRNYIVDLHSIESIDPGRGGFVRLVDGSQIAIAYRRKAELKGLWSKLVTDY